MVTKREEYEKQYLAKGIRYNDLKEALANAIYKELETIQKKRAVLEKDPSFVNRVLKEGQEKAQINF